MELTKSHTLASSLTQYFFLFILNVVIVSILGYLTLDSEANINSRTGAFLLSFFIPIFIVFYTNEMSGLERMLKFGIGMIGYLLAVTVIVGLPASFTTGLIPCLIIALGVLFYGRKLIEDTKN